MAFSSERRDETDRRRAAPALLRASGKGADRPSGDADRSRHLRYPLPQDSQLADASAACCSGFAINFGIGPPEGGVLFALQGFAAGFGIYMVLYVLRAMGAGDVKLMARGRRAGRVGAVVRHLLRDRDRRRHHGDRPGCRSRTAQAHAVQRRVHPQRDEARPPGIRRERGAGRPQSKAVGLPHGAVIAMSTILSSPLAARLSH